MKTFKYLFLAFAAAFVLAGCSDDPTYTPGDADSENNYGVYFPTQDNAGNQEFDPADPTTLKLTAMRTKDTDAITVPVEITSNEEGIFTATEITFMEGATETEFVVSFPKAEIGKTYKCNIRVTDKQYASIYGQKPTGVDFSVTRVKWNLVTGKGGETKGKWRDDILSSHYSVPNKFAEADVEIFERADQPGFYRIMSVYSESYMDKIMVQYAYGRVDAINYINATDPAKVYLPEQSTGATVIEAQGIVNFASFVPENSFPNNKEYGTLQDGVITFPTKGIGIQRSATPADWYYGNTSGLLRIMFPGAKEYDYSLVLSKSAPADGKVNISAKLGTDVAKVKYAFFEGSFSKTLAAAKSGDMAAGLLGDKVKEITATGTIVAEMEKTGIYTIVANIYNAAGELKDHKYLPFGYIAAGEEKPVVLGLGINITDKYAPEGFTSENSAEIYVYGEEIESGYWGLFETDKIPAGTNLTTLVKASGKAFTAEQITKINGNGFSGVVGSLVGGTGYTLIISAYNGYVSKTFSAKATTNGTPHPLKRSYTTDDYAGPIAKTDLLKTWNLWAGLFEDKKLPGRVSLGEVIISENTAKDAAGLDAINLKGLTAGESDVDDTIYWNYDAQLGIIKTLKMQPMGWLIAQNGSKFFLGYSIADVDNSMGSATLDNMMAGIQVEEGYMAFVSLYEDYNFNSLVVNAHTDEALVNKVGYWLWMYDLILEDPAVAEASGAAVAAAKRAQIQQLTKEVKATPSNYVELRGIERFKAILKERAGKPANRAKEILPVEMPDLGVVKAKVTFTKGIAETPTTGPLVSTGIRANVEVK